MEEYSNGRPRTKIIYKKGTQDGYENTYDFDGRLQSAAVLKDGKPTGEFKDYHSNGKIYHKVFFLEDGIHLREIVYSEEGVITLETTTKNKLYNGEYKFYYESGALCTVRIYNESRLWEVESYFDINGNSLETGTLKEGTGTVNIYDDDGNLVNVWNVIEGQIK